MTTIRLTVGQAIVRFLAVQYTERDGVEQRFIAGVWGIFGHGNVAGLGQALEELGDEYALPHYRPQNEQARSTPRSAYAKRQEPHADVRVHRLHRPGATNMITGAAAATVNRLPVLLLPSDFANRRRTRCSSRSSTRSSTTSRPTTPSGPSAATSTGSPPRAAAVQRCPRPCACSPIPGRDRRGDDLPAARTSRPRSSTGPERVLRQAGSGDVRRPPPEPSAARRGGGLIANAERPLIIAGGGAIYSGAEAALDAVATSSASRSPRARPARVCCPGTTR